MARDLSLLSTTPANNDQVGGFATGMRPSSVKNAGWADESIIAQLFNSKTTAGGTANAITLANPVPLTTLTNGLTCIFWPSAANTGHATFAPDAVTVKNIVVSQGTGTVQLNGGELSPGIPAWLKYNGTAWVLQNPVANNVNFSTNEASTGTNTITNAFAAGLPCAPQAYVSGCSYTLPITNTITAAPALNINGLGAKNIYYPDGVTQLAAGSLIAGLLYTFVYSGALNSSAGGFICINPSRVTSSFTATLATGFTTTPTGTINYNILPDGSTVQTYCVSGLTATSNTTGWTVTGAPAAIQAAHAWTCTVGQFTDTGGRISGAFAGMNGGTWTALGGGSLTSAGFTNTGSKGIPAAWWATYSKD